MRPSDVSSLLCVVVAITVTSLAFIIKRYAEKLPETPAQSRALLTASTRPRAIAVLTRGYDKLEEYGKLIQRNRSIVQFPWASEYDHIIFHEGNISSSHQEYITKETAAPYALVFIDVSDSFRRNSSRANDGGRNCMRSDWPTGYKCMCAFWFADFLRYVSDYDDLLRIDEDCTLESTCTRNPVTTALIGSGNIHDGMDAAHVIDGLSSLARTLSDGMFLPPLEQWSSPCTHIFWLNLNFARSTPVQRIVERVSETNCIMTNRWGDLPLWGMTAALLGIPLTYLNLSYHHGSWNETVSAHSDGGTMSARPIRSTENLKKAS